MGDFDRWGGGGGRDHWDRTTQDFLRTISNPRGGGEERQYDPLDPRHPDNLAKREQERERERDQQRSSRDRVEQRDSKDRNQQWDYRNEDRRRGSPVPPRDRRRRSGSRDGREKSSTSSSYPSSYDNRYDDDRGRDGGFGVRFRGGSPERHGGQRDRGISPPRERPYNYRRRTPDGREGSRDGSWRSRSSPRSWSRSRSRSPRPPGLPPSPSERERELRRLERDTLRIGPAAADAATAAAAAATVSEVDLRAVLDIGRKAKEAVATGLVRNLKNAAARTLQSRQQQQQQQQHQAPPDSHHGDALSHQHYRALDPNISLPSSGNVTAMGEASGPLRTGREGVAPINEESREKLRAGNYLVATWDAMTDGHQYDGVISQVGAYLPHGVSYVKQFVDVTVKPEDMKRYYVHQGRMCIRFNERTIVPMDTTELGLTEFLDFLERGKTSARPAYDGVLLLSHIRESIPILLRAVKNHSGLEGRFRRVVAGMGDISAYLADHHRDKFHADNGQVDLGLFNVFAKVNGYKAEKRCTCEQRATHSYEILRELLGEKPNYSNFFGRYIHPMGSAVITEMAKFRGLRERVALFLPLQLYLAKELQRDSGLLVVDGVYAPQSKQEVNALGLMAGKAEKVSLAVCRMLVTSGLDFDAVLDDFKREGPDKAELRLRTAFLNKMSCQSKAVIDQTVRTSRLAVDYFVRNGERDAEDLARCAALELAVLEARKVGDAEEQRAYRDKFERLGPAVEYFRMRLTQNETSDAATKADMMANVLIQAGLELHTLIDIFEEDRATPIEEAQRGRHPKRKRIKKKLLQIVRDVYQVHSVPGLSVSEFVDHAVGYLKSTVFSAASVMPKGKKEGERAKDKRPPATAALESARRRLEAATFERYNSFDGGMAHFRENVATLVPLKFYLVDNWLDSDAVDAAARRKAADFVQNLLAFHDQNCSELSAAYSVGSAAAAASALESLLRARPDLLPEGHSAEALAGCVVGFFARQREVEGAMPSSLARFKMSLEQGGSGSNPK